MFNFDYENACYMTNVSVIFDGIGVCGYDKMKILFYFG